MRMTEPCASRTTWLRKSGATALAAASNAKFPEYRMTRDFYRSNGAIAIRMRKVIPWTDITRDPTRFRFSG